MMERALKERIIGAVVLVAVVVLVVPVFLDGPPVDGEVRSERVPLPGQDEQNTQTIVLDRDRTEPVPAKLGETPPAEVPTVEATDSRPVPAAVVSETPAPKPVAQEPRAQSKPPADEPVETKPAPVPAAASATGMFAVQLGSFSNKQNAEKLAADLRKQGFAAFLSQLQTDSGQLQRVRIGPQKDRQAAEAMAARLAKAGHKGQVVPHP
tara:strand:- start:4173 stop:4799 length:627 start_codon:yes stop_codon:yes gene_type:complete